MKSIIKILEERKNKPTNALVMMPEKTSLQWFALPAYAHMYIRPAYELIQDMEGLYEYVHHFLSVYDESDNEAKRMCIRVMIFPLYKGLTGHNYDTNIFKAMI